jgi:hypothetical protein
MPRSKNTRPPSARAQVEALRRRLFEAHAIVEVTRFALSSRLIAPDDSAIDDAVADALDVALRLIDDTASAMERST